MVGTVFVVVVLLRFFVPLLIPKFPLPAILACLVIDAADQTIFQAFTDDPMPGYQTYDKALDVYYLAIAYFSTMRNWRDPAAFQVARFLYIYRLVGVAAFELFDARWLLLVFPNTFEYFFIAYEAVRTKWNPTRLRATAVVSMAAFIWIVIKLPQEWWIHVAKLDFTDFMANHPYMWGVLALAAAGAGLAIWLNRRRIPAADWPFTVDVDRHLDPVTIGSAPVGRFLNVVLLEKIVLLALLTVIFVQILPDVQSSNLSIAIGASIAVLLNAAVTTWLQKRGRTWATTGRQFVAMLVINVGIVLVDSIFGSNIRSNAPALRSLFFVLLLALLIALFDRFRSTRDDSGAPRLRDQWRQERAAGRLRTT